MNDEQKKDVHLIQKVKSIYFYFTNGLGTVEIVRTVENAGARNRMPKIRKFKKILKTLLKTIRVI